MLSGKRKWNYDHDHIQEWFFSKRDRSKMFIDKDGNSYGSIGGGNVEFQALKYAPEAQHGEIRKYNLSNQGGANLGMICGGEVEVLYELL